MCLSVCACRGQLGRARHFPLDARFFVMCTSCFVVVMYFGESSLLRINQRHHSLRTRLWYTPPAAVKKPTEENARERGLGVGVGRDSRYGSIYVCPPSPSRGPAPRCSSLSSSPLPSVPWIPHPQLVPLGAGVGRGGRRVHRAQVSGSGGLLGDMLEVGRWRAGVNP